MEKVDNFLEKMGLNECEKCQPLKKVADKLNIKVEFILIHSIMNIIF